MKKKIFQLISVVFILVLVLLIFRSRSPFGKSNTSFAALPKNEITRIEISSGKEKLTLEKTKDQWHLDGGKEVRKSGIMLITRVLNELKIKSPVSPELFDTVVTQKNIIPVKVKAFENSRLLTSFLVYKTPSNIYGNIMRTRERSKPFIVYVPGFDGNIGAVFTLNRLYWQPYTIFNLMPSEIVSVDFRNTADTSSSFSVIRNKQRIILTDGSVQLAGYDSVAVGRYLSYYTWIPFETWALEISQDEKNTILGSKPAYEISVKKTDGGTIKLTLWERNGVNGEKDSDRLYGKTESSAELFIVRYFDIDPLLKKRSYFFGK
jgi:hypothetical protein